MFYDNRIKPLIKWTGGKSQELPIIKEYLPKSFKNYYEPFIGGGAVWLSVDITKHKLYINDFSEDLILFYKSVKEQDELFIFYVSRFVFIWEKIEFLVENHKIELSELFTEYNSDNITFEELTEVITKFINTNKVISNYMEEEKYFQTEYIKQVTNKFKRMKKNSLTKGSLSDIDIIINIETGFKTGLYVGCRTLYNNKRVKKDPMYIALYFIMRNYAYSGMFRFNNNGDFNVPYGGNSYNSKNLKTKMEFYLNDKLQKHLNKTKMYNLDFEEFLSNKVTPSKNDFIFLDPPYDSEFSTYDGNSFERKEQIRLADLMLNTKAQWMMVIKYTDFIYELYNKKNINIIFFDKKYQVSIMDRNEQKVQHILIKNY